MAFEIQGCSLINVSSNFSAYTQVDTDAPVWHGMLMLTSALLSAGAQVILWIASAKTSRSSCDALTVNVCVWTLLWLLLTSLKEGNRLYGLLVFDSRVAVECICKLTGFLDLGFQALMAFGFLIVICEKFWLLTLYQRRPLAGDENGDWVDDDVFRSENQDRVRILIVLAMFCAIAIGVAPTIVEESECLIFRNQDDPSRDVTRFKCAYSSHAAGVGMAVGRMLITVVIPIAIAWTLICIAFIAHFRKSRSYMQCGQQQTNALYQTVPSASSTWSMHTVAIVRTSTPKMDSRRVQKRKALLYMVFLILPILVCFTPLRSLELSKAINIAEAVPEFTGDFGNDTTSDDPVDRNGSANAFGNSTAPDMTAVYLYGLLHPWFFALYLMYPLFFCLIAFCISGSLRKLLF